MVFIKEEAECSAAASYYSEFIIILVLWAHWILFFCKIPSTTRKIFKCFVRSFGKVFLYFFATKRIFENCVLLYTVVVHYWRRVEKLLHVLCTHNPCRLFLLQSRYFVLLLHLILFTTTTTTTVIHRFPLHNTPANCPSSSSPFSIQFKRFWIIYENIHKLQLNYSKPKRKRVHCTHVNLFGTQLFAVIIIT